MDPKNRQLREIKKRMPRKIMNRYSTLNFSLTCELRQQDYLPYIESISNFTLSVASSGANEQGRGEAGRHTGWGALQTDQISNFYQSLVDVYISKL